MEDKIIFLTSESNFIKIDDVFYWDMKPNWKDNHGKSFLQVVRTYGGFYVLNNRKLRGKVFVSLNRYRDWILHTHPTTK